MRKSKLKLGEILLKEGLITEAQLEEALGFQKISARPIGDIVVEKGFVSERDLASTLAKQIDIPFASLADGSLTPSNEAELTKLIPEAFARQNLVLPLSKHLNSITVAFSDPLNFIVSDNLRQLTGCDIHPVIAMKTDIREAITKLYGTKDLLSEAVDMSYATEEHKEIAARKAEDRESLEETMAKADQAPVIKLVNLLLIQAVRERASDIHIEPFKERINVRIRIDGILHTIAPPSQHLLPALISRIKIMSKMDIAEKRLPQDGAFSVKIEDRVIDVRVSVIPTIFGEKAVLRILDKGALILEVDKLGFSEKDLIVFKESITKPYGLMLLTGPTGSGKTTTLYAALTSIKSEAVNIITVEDPVEYQIEGLNQVQVKPKIGLTFAEALRYFLRQDPDVMMVGEIRDLETAEMCIRAALTGHLVLSTLHTNDAPSAVTRLVDIGLEPYLVSSSLILIVAQRLVRKLCPKCKELAKMPDDMVKRFNLPKKEAFKAKGCEICKNTGYSGRLAIHESLYIDETMRALIAKETPTMQIREAAKKAGMKTLIESGMQKVIEGITTVEEVLSSAYES